MTESEEDRSDWLLLLNFVVNLRCNISILPKVREIYQKILLFLCSNFDSRKVNLEVKVVHVVFLFNSLNKLARIVIELKWMESCDV